MMFRPTLFQSSTGVPFTARIVSSGCSWASSGAVAIGVTLPTTVDLIVV